MKKLIIAFAGIFLTSLIGFSQSKGVLVGLDIGNKAPEIGRAHV